MRWVRAVPRLCDDYPGIYLTTEEKARKNLSHGNTLHYKTINHTLQNTHTHKHITKQSHFTKKL
jgi:hypothetical protein